MNRLKTTDIGGFPLRLDDFRWIDEAERETFLGVIKTLIGAQNNCILYGCEVVDSEQGDVWECTDGFVFFNDEIYYVAAHNVVHDNNVLYFGEDIDYDSDGYKVFENTDEHQAYEIRRAKLFSGTTAPSDTMPWNTSDFITIFKARLNLYQPPAPQPWTHSTLTSSNVSLYGGGLSSIVGKMAYKIEGKTAFVAIELKVTVSAAGSMIKVKLPTGVKIKRDIYTTSLIHNLQASTGKYPVLRIIAWNDEDNLIISSIFSDEDINSGNYELNGEIFFEIL